MAVQGLPEVRNAVLEAEEIAIYMWEEGAPLSEAEDVAAGMSGSAAHSLAALHSLVQVLQVSTAACTHQHPSTACGHCTG